MHKFWTNYPKKFLGKLTIATFLCLLRSITLKGLRTKRNKDLRFLYKLGKNCRFFFISKMKESLHLLAKNLLIPLTLEKISAPVDSIPPKIYPFPLNNDFNVMTQ